jgi:hypothetical protein
MQFVDGVIVGGPDRPAARYETQLRSLTVRATRNRRWEVVEDVPSDRDRRIIADRNSVPLPVVGLDFGIAEFIVGRCGNLVEGGREPEVRQLRELARVCPESC